VFAPLAVLFYCLIYKRGILDGWPGLYYAFQRTLAELLLSLYLIEADLAYASRKFKLRKNVRADTGERVSENRS
jgi:hypothetical protein